MKRMYKRTDRNIDPARKRQIDRYEKDGAEKTGLDEDVRVTYSEEHNPHDG